MEKIEIPPFYVGQEVVANCNHHQGIFKKGDEFKITSIRRSFCSCKDWAVTIGIIGSGFSAIQRCPVCKEMTSDTKPTDEWLFSAWRFSPKIEIKEFISMKQLVEEKLELVSVN